MRYVCELENKNDRTHLSFGMKKIQQAKNSATPS